MRKRTLQFGLLVFLLTIALGWNVASWITSAVATRAEAAENAKPSHPQSPDQRSTGLDANHALSVLIWANSGDGIWTVTNAGMELTAVQLGRDTKTQNKVFIVRTRMPGAENWTHSASYNRAGAAIKAMQAAGAIQPFKKFVDGRVVD